MEDNVRAFYDDYAPLQKERGINQRHLRIMQWLEQFGLKDGMRVLEIGCGIGTQTELLSAKLPNGRLLAMDISPRSIEMASERLAGKPQVELLCGDIITLNVGGNFDMIVLPDVLEHIPVAEHEALFQKLAQVLKANGQVVIHIPSPQSLEWVIAHHPEQLQVIDQPLHMDRLIPAIIKAGLYPHHLQHYGLWSDDPDAAVIVLRHYSVDLPFIPVPPPVGWFGGLRRRIAKYRGRG
ncbi:MAG: methyltransferase domain-containing protein [Flavobacteriales bacterium]